MCYNHDSRNDAHVSDHPLNMRPEELDPDFQTALEMLQAEQDSPIVMLSSREGDPVLELFEKMAEDMGAKGQIDPDLPAALTLLRESLKVQEHIETLANLTATHLATGNISAALKVSETIHQALHEVYLSLRAQGLTDPRPAKTGAYSTCDPRRHHEQCAPGTCMTCDNVGH